MHKAQRHHASAGGERTTITAAMTAGRHVGAKANGADAMEACPSPQSK